MPTRTWTCRATAKYPHLTNSDVDHEPQKMPSRQLLGMTKETIESKRGLPLAYERSTRVRPPDPLLAFGLSLCFIWRSTPSASFAPPLKRIINHSAGHYST